MLMDCLGEMCKSPLRVDAKVLIFIFWCVKVCLGLSWEN